MVLARVLCGAILLALASPAFAHSQQDGRPSGLAIPGLTHAEIAVVSGYRSAIMDLASRQALTDSTFRRLLNQANTQFAVCAWGLAPGSIDDVNGPFDACSHAYLAAAEALLEHMRANVQAARSEAEELRLRIDTDKGQTQASTVGCDSSSDTFATGTLVSADWKSLPSHPASALALASLAGTAFGGIFIFMKATRRRVERDGAVRLEAAT